MSRVRVVKLTYQDRNSLKLAEMKVRTYYYEKEIKYILKGEVSNENGPYGMYSYLEMRINMDRVDNKEAVERLINEFREFVKIVNSGEEHNIKKRVFNLMIYGDAFEIANILMGIATEIAKPYSTRGCDVYVWDSGGDYPHARVRFRYFG